MTGAHPTDPLHGVTLEAIVEDLVARHGWAGLGARIPLDCFRDQPTLTSSLKFLRRTPWARAKVERLYVEDRRRIERNARRNRRRKAQRAHRAQQDAARERPPEGDAS